MSELIEAMIDLNRVDKRIVQGKLRLQELSRGIAAQEAKVEEARAKARTVEQAIKEKMFATDRLNMDIRAAESEVADQEKKLKAIKNQKEFRIVTDRIKDLKIRVDENESTAIADMEEVDRLREKMTAAHNQVGVEDLKLTSAREKAQAEAAGIKERHAQLLEERKAAVLKVQSVDEQAYHAYDESLKRTKGDPIAEMTMDGICQSCFRRQNSNVLNMVHIGKDVKNCRCQGCGRILYVRNRDGEAEAE